MDKPEDRSELGFQVSEDILPIGEFKAHLSEKIRALRERKRPLVVTQNGKAAAVVLAPEDFDRLTAQARFLAAVQEGLADHEAGRTISHEEMGRQLDERFGVSSKKK